MLRKGDGEASVGHAKPEIRADHQSNPIRLEVGIGQIPLPGRKREDLLDVPIAKFWLCAENQSGKAGDQGR